MTLERNEAERGQKSDARRASGRSRRVPALAAGLALCMALTACETTRFYERQRLSDRCMKLDHDRATAYIRVKAEAAREGALGGFGMSPAGGCGCE